jgi:hypothetical protein
VAKISLQDVLARWAYSEISDANLSQEYDRSPFIPLYRAQLNDLRSKRGSGVTFNELDHTDRYWLSFMCSCVRPNLMIFMAGIEHFDEVDLDKTDLAKLLVPTMVHGQGFTPTGEGFFLSFADYIQTSSCEPKDARNVTGDYRPAAEAISIGRFGQHLVLLDGYHRAASFWKFASADASITAYRPTF